MNKWGAEVKAGRTWDERVAQARALGKFDNEAKLMSECWTTCAVGELFGVANMPRAEWEEVVALRLQGISCSRLSGLTRAEVEEIQRLGFDFWNAVTTDRVQDAVEAYEKLKEFSSRQTEWGVTS